MSLRSNTTTIKQPYSNVSRPAQLSTPLPIKRLTPDEMATRKAKGICQQAPLQFGTTCFHVNLLLLPIYDVDLVLGVEWLAVLGPILFDYKELWMEFAHDSAKIRPIGLPPPRLLDHHIPLVPNTTPVSVKPYRYPHYQKSEIEKLVGEMLSDGIIRPSCSPYSYLVLLVKKKDGSWQFYVDYRALNSVTVKDRVPIPIVDELLDELHGACVFFKLD
ncbi:transposon ty3-I gag-pol polyprotein [Tanacetum coccineum]